MSLWRDIQTLERNLAVVKAESQLARREERLTRVEERLGQLADDVQSLATTVKELAGVMGRKAEPRWGLYIAAATFVFSLTIATAGAIWSILIVPLQSRAESLQAQTSLVREMLMQHAGETMHPGTAQVIREIETQFKASDMLRNEQRQTADMVLRMLWRKAYGEELPGRDYWPEVASHPASGVH